MSLLYRWGRDSPMLALTKYLTPTNRKSMVPSAQYVYLSITLFVASAMQILPVLKSVDGYTHSLILPGTLSCNPISLTPNAVLLKAIPIQKSQLAYPWSHYHEDSPVKSLLGLLLKLHSFWYLWMKIIFSQDVSIMQYMASCTFFIRTFIISVPHDFSWQPYPSSSRFRMLFQVWLVSSPPCL